MEESYNHSSDGPTVRTSLPGPDARALIEADGAVITPSSPRMHPLALQRAEGLVVEDVDGNEFWDFAAGIAVTNVGHDHPAVTAAAKAQLDELTYAAFCDYYSPEPVRLAERLVEIAPGDSPKRVYYGNSGAEAVEAGIKLARHHTGRSHVVAFEGAFHGRTLGALSLTASKAKYREGFGPLVPNVEHVPYPDPAKTGDPDAAIEETFDALETALWTRVPADDLAAIVVEPIQGEGGYVVPPEEFHPRLRQFADEHGALLVADEIQSGFGRTGEWFAMDHWGVEPDITLMGKGIANGLPMSAMVAREEVMTWGPGAHASTYHGNPVISAAANAVIDVIEDEDLLENARDVGASLREQLRAVADDTDSMGSVRGLGLMVGVDFVDPETGEPDGDLAEDAIDAAFERGLILLPCGPSSVRFAPPLTITDEQATRGVELFAEAVRDVTG